MRKNNLSWIVAYLALIIFVSFTPISAKAQLKIEMLNGNEVAANEAIVKFNHSGTLSGQALQQAEARSIADIRARQDIGEVHPIEGIGAHLLRSRSLMAGNLIAQLKLRRDVAYVEPNYVIHEVRTPNDPNFSSLYGMQKISAPSAWEVSVGTPSVVVGVIDTGIDYTHVDLTANVWSAPSAFTVTIGGQTITCPAGSHGFNAILNNCDPFDTNNHGTHVSGTIGAVGNNSVGVAGVNWSTSIMASQFLDSSGQGSTVGAINAIEFTVLAKNHFAATANVRVLNNSWGGGPFSQALLDEINRAASNNMLFVAAAGNNGTNNDTSPFYPASYSATNIVAVAATDSNDLLASFSNFGASSVHLGAPGVQILSTIPGNGYALEDGTSMASPHVAGAAALVLSRCNLSVSQLKSAILQNVDVVSSLVQKTTTGGRLNVNKAIRSCLPSPVGALASQIDSATSSLEVYYMGSDQHVHQWTWNSTNGWFNVDLNTLSGGTNSVANGPTANIMDTLFSRPEVFYVGTDQDVREFFWDSSTGWHPADISAAAGGAPPAATSVKSLTALMDTVTGRPEVYYVGSTDQHIHQLYFDSSTGWHHADISAFTNAPNVAVGGNVTSMVNTITNAPEVWYVGQDQGIHEIIWNSVTGWAHYNISNLAGAPQAPATAGLTILVDSLNARNEAYYLGTDSHVHQLYWINGVGWGTSDMNNVTGAPAAASGSGITSLIDTLTSQLEIYYVSSNQHVWQIGWTGSRGFFKLDVTGTTIAPNALSGSTLTALVDSLDSGLEIYYIGSDQHTHQLQWTVANGWRQFDVNHGN
jgi:thermitase